MGDLCATVVLQKQKHTLACLDMTTYAGALAQKHKHVCMRTHARKHAHHAHTRTRINSFTHRARARMRARIVQLVTHRGDGALSTSTCISCMTTLTAPSRKWPSGALSAVPSSCVASSRRSEWVRVVSGGLARFG